LSGSKNLTPYAVPVGGLPAQSERLADRAIFTTAYAVIPKTVMTDIVTSPVKLGSVKLGSVKSGEDLKRPPTG
jgi:hypothetical protein